MNILSTNSSQKGSTLIEVLVALLVFTVGLQGIASMQYQAVKDNFDSSQRNNGIWAAQDLINRIRANPLGRTDPAPNGSYTFNGDPCAAIPAIQCADTNVNNAANCTASQMAAFDIWESICPTQNQAQNQNQSQLLNPTLTIACADAPCTENSQFTLSLQWQAKSVSDDAVIQDDANNTLATQQFQQVFRP